MPRIHSVVRAGLVLAALGLTACGPDIPTPAQRGAVWGLDRAQRFIPIRLPWGHHGRSDWKQGGPVRVILNVLPSGAVQVKGEVFHLHSAGDAEGSSAVETLRSAIRATVDFQVTIGREPPTSFLHADARAPWSVTRQLLRLLVEGPPSMAHGGWALRSVELPTIDCGTVARFLEPQTDVPAGGTLSLVLHRRDGRTVVRVGERSWTVNPTEPDDPDALVERDPAWDEIEETLRRLSPSIHAAALAMVGDVASTPWGHVAGALDALLGAGALDVTLPEAGVRIVLEPGEPCAEPVDDPVMTPWLLFACVLAVVAAFGLTFATWPRRRRR